MAQLNKLKFKATTIQSNDVVAVGINRQRNFPTPIRFDRKDCPTKQQVGAQGWRRPCDYNRNREQSRRRFSRRLVRGETVG